MDELDRWTDLRERLERADLLLREKASRTRGAEASRLEGKAAGVRLALSYMTDYRAEHRPRT